MTKETRICYTCGQELLISDFPFTKINERIYYKYTCRSCLNKKECESYARVPDGHKKCTKCKQIKQCVDFRTKVSKSGTNVLYSRCRECEKIDRSAHKSKSDSGHKCRMAKYNAKTTTKTKKRHQHLKSLGMTTAGFENMMVSQNGQCAICGDNVKLCVDHCHTTGFVRGLLCNNCNIGLGMFRDDPHRLVAATEYLKTQSPLKFVDLAAENRFFLSEIMKEVKAPILSGHFLLGAQMERLERRMSELSCRRHAVAVKNATDAISLIMKTLYKPGMPVIVPNFGAYPTAIACLSVINKRDLYYVDVDRTMTMDPEKLPDIESGIVIFVALFGNNGNVQHITDLCHQRGHVLIVDAAQSTGSGAERFGDYAVFSFYPTKPLASCGDGGMIVSNENLEDIRALRFYGMRDGQVIIEGGVNSRMDEIQCAIVNAKFPRFMELTDKRRLICQRYLNIVKGITWKGSPVFHQFPILVKDRGAIETIMNEEGIPYMIHYPHHVSDFLAVRANGEVGYRVNDKILSLPCHPFMTEAHISKIERFLERVHTYEVRT